jgi:pSer/pThr/pTyr-binding forkhead associated (FHA) protein
MVRLRILSGNNAGGDTLVRRFPFRVGRSASDHLQLEESGVWDRHLEFSISPGKGILMKVSPEAIASVNGQPAQEVILKNGDVIDLGAVKIGFWLAETTQKSLRFREWMTWAGFVLIAAFQLFLIYYLLR